MAIIHTITDPYYFYNWMRNSDSYSNNFSVEGARELFDYLNNLSDELDNDMQFDPIAWCCTYSEYDNISDYNKQHGTSFKNYDELEDHTTVIRIEDTDRAIVEDY